MLTRRDTLKLGVLASAGLMLPLERVAQTQLAFAERLQGRALSAPYTMRFVRPPVLHPVRRSATTDFYSLTMRPRMVEVVPGLRTQIWGYNGSFPGPTIHAFRGRPTVVRQINGLPRRHPRLLYRPTTSVHLHGSASLPEYDGYASDVSDREFFKDYHYPQIQEARTDWYHDHGVHHTAPNVGMGLMAQYQMHDRLERSLPLPQGPYDVPLIVVDAAVAADGSLIFNADDESGAFGNVITVNGRTWPVMNVERRKYRFRILNASVSRSYRWVLSTGEPLVVIGTDGGLMSRPRPVATLRHGMAERYEVVIDFAKYRIGQRVELHNLSPDNNVDFADTDQVMAFDVVDQPSTLGHNRVPDELNPHNATMALTESMSVRTRQFVFKRENGLWTINGKTWADVINSGFTFVAAKPRLGDVEIWELSNPGGGWFHPVHIHLVDFKILDRNGDPPFDYERGPKDVAYVGEGETVRVIARFGPQQGKYMMHCHNLVHEDHDMMTQFEVGTHGHDPLNSARPLPVDAMRPL
jgi:spore coat protein A, manganese oxidase